MTDHPATSENTYPWVTAIELRQPSNISHEVAYANALDAAQSLMAAGYDVQLRPTLRDLPTPSFSDDWEGGMDGLTDV